jgi:hypothetical protein
MNRSFKIIALMGVLLLILGLLGAIAVFAEDGVDSFNLRGRFGFGRQGLVEQETVHEAVADTLGVTVAEVDAASTAGRRPADLAQEQGVDPATTGQAARTAALAQAGDDGLVTEAQAGPVWTGWSRHASRRPGHHAPGDRGRARHLC